MRAHTTKALGPLAAVLFLTGCHDDSNRIDELEAAGRGPGPKGEQGAKGDPGPQGDAGAPGPAGKDGVISGSRLKARYRVGEDGARAFVGWHDSMLDADCDFQLAADGKERCLPSVTWDQNIAFGYSDAACTKPRLLWQGAACSMTGTYVKQSGKADDCDPARQRKQRVFKFGAQTSSQQENAPYYSADSGCSPASASGPIDVYDAEELPPSAFVGGSVQAD